MPGRPRSRTPTSGLSLRMPQDVRKRIRVAAALDDERVRDWIVRILDAAATARVAREVGDAHEMDDAPALPAAEPHRHFCDEVIGQVATYYGISVAQLLSRSRRAPVVRRRQVAIFLCAKFTGASATEIGNFFYREHPAVGNAIRVVSEAVGKPGEIQRDVEALTAKLEALKTEGDGPSQGETR